MLRLASRSAGGRESASLAARPSWPYGEGMRRTQARLANGERYGSERVVIAQPASVDETIRIFEMDAERASELRRMVERLSSKGAGRGRRKLHPAART